MSHRLTSTGIKLLVGLSLLLVAAVGRPTAAVQPAPEDAVLKQFNAAITDAAVYRKAHLRRLIPLKFDPKSGTARVATLTGDAYPATGSYKVVKDVWVTAVPEVQDRCKGHDGDLEMFLRQLLGLHPNAKFTHFVVMDVKKADVFRPAPDPDTTTEWPYASLHKGQNPGQMFPDGVSDEHVRWIANQMLFAYMIDRRENKDGYPWTRLGYTYNWEPGADRYGASEYVVRNGAVVTIDGVIPYREYCTGQK